MIGGIWIYGIQDEYFKSLMMSDGVRVTLDARKRRSFPAELYIIADEDGDEIHCIDFLEEEGTIKIWDVYKGEVVDILDRAFE